MRAAFHQGARPELEIPQQCSHRYRTSRVCALGPSKRAM